MILIVELNSSCKILTLKQVGPVLFGPYWKNISSPSVINSSKYFGNKCSSSKTFRGIEMFIGLRLNRCDLLHLGSGF